MTKLERIIERLKALPPEEQERLAGEIEFVMDQGPLDSVLTDEQWAKLEADLERDQELIPHEQVVAQMKAKYGA